MSLRSIQAGEGGFGATVARGGLAALSGGWALVQALKPFAYRSALRTTERLPVPVVSVGNITVGGTGKTPFVAWLCEKLRAGGHVPGILARGYGPVVVPAGSGGPLNDEGAVLRATLGETVPQVQRPDRVAGAKALLAAHPATDVLVLDDGFQHWRIERDLDIVLIDATCPFGHGHYLPRGRLREQPAALGRAGAVVITRANRVSEAALCEVQQRVRLHTDAPVARAVTRPLRTFDGVAVFAACGIGNPAAFVATLEEAGANVVGKRFFDDHEAFLEPGSLDLVREAAQAAGAAEVVITQKDAVKLAERPADVTVLDITLELTAGEEALLAVVQAALWPATEA